MQNRRRVIALTGLLLATMTSAATAEIPPLLYTSEPHQDKPAWVSAEAAVDPEGNLNSELFFESALPHLNYLLTHPLSSSGCLEVEESWLDRVNPRDRTTLAKAARHSAVVLIARVVGKDFGIKFSTPGQLLEIEAIRYLEGRLAEQSYFVFLPLGEFELGERRICKTDFRYARAPEVGEEVALLIEKLGTNPDDRYLDLVEASSLVVIGPGGAVDAPHKTRKDHPFTRAGNKEQVLDEILQALKGHA